MKWKSIAGDPYETTPTYIFIISEFCPAPVEFVPRPAHMGVEVDSHFAPGEARELFEMRRKVKIWK